MDDLNRRAVLQTSAAAMLASAATPAQAAMSDIVKMDARSLSKAIAAKKVSWVCCTAFPMR
jgi:hypothetical protein